MAGTDTVAALVAVAKTLTDAAKALTDLATSLNQATTPDKLVLTVSGDMDSTGPIFSVNIDGKLQLRPTMVTAVHGQTTQDWIYIGTIDAKAKVTVTYGNDTYNRNLYIHKVTLNGKALPAATAPSNGSISADGVVTMLGNGSVDFSADGKATTASPTPVPTPSPGTGTTSPPTGSGTTTTSPGTTPAQPTSGGKLLVGGNFGNGDYNADGSTPIGGYPRDYVKRHMDVVSGGRAPDLLGVYGGEDSRGAMTSWCKAAAERSGGSAAKAIMFSVPVVSETNKSLDFAASGGYDDVYREQARQLVGIPYKRFLWEGNGNWMKWQWGTNPGAFGPLAAATFNRAAKIFRDANPAAKNIICMNISQANPEFVLSHVDMSLLDGITFDFYCFPGPNDDKVNPNGMTAAQYFAWMRTRDNGLDNMQALGRKYGKWVGIDEWGVGKPGAEPFNQPVASYGTMKYPEYIDQVFAWATSNAGSGPGQVHHLMYWDLMAGYPSGLCRNQVPENAAAYAAAIKKYAAYLA